MTPYNNSESGVESYEIGDDYIRIQFKEGKTYTYLSSKIGALHFNMLIQLAKQNEGLNTYINTNNDVKSGYQERQ